MVARPTRRGLGVLVAVALLVGVLTSVTVVVVADDDDTGILEGGEDLARDLGLVGSETMTKIRDGLLLGDGSIGGTPDRPAPDRDGDLLADSWERAGELPDGTPLPGADPDRKDIYVYLSYGSNVERLTQGEKIRLKRIWAEMPVSNPDGSTGIDLHIVRADRLDHAVTVESVDAEAVRGHYTRERLDGGLCTYYGVTVGELDAGRYLGLGDAPGYASVVHRDAPWYAHNGTGVSGVITHELLHNVAGRVGEDGHTGAGWLSGERDGPRDFLSEPTRTRLNETGFVFPDANHGYYYRLCTGQETTTEN
ncbi:hypothetical protein [Haloarchaeobius sp. HME9146]|uniref:hypothetical protein n=1 Tax=Haloarchaeobius sp. HME9146 TaxID=2978732 RepID=UPI0021BEC422|nr:hypothetical protein [Haloarchaeobius sp. HME9146]MCT9097539.1 hypothetical protein [Haloarchaeobius sp. HME9146]